MIVGQKRVDMAVLGLWQVVWSRRFTCLLSPSPLPDHRVMASTVVRPSGHAILAEQQRELAVLVFTQAPDDSHREDSNAAK